jgi:hypothetical protein
MIAWTVFHDLVLPLLCLVILIVCIIVYFNRRSP